MDRSIFLAKNRGLTFLAFLGGLKVKKHPIFGFWASSHTLIHFAKKIESKRPILTPAGSETINTRLYGVATANSDDPYRGPLMNNKDH